MVSQANTNYQQILTQALGQLKGLEGGTGSPESSKNNYSQVAWFKEAISSGQDIEQLVNGNDQQKASAIQNVLSTITGLLNLGTGESSKANQETTKNSKNAAELDTKAKQSTQVTEAKVNEILNQISQNKTSIEDAIATIQELGGDEGVAGAQEKLQEQLEIIETNKQILNNKEAKPEEKEAALQALEAASGVIAELVGTVNQYQAQIEAQNSTVEATSENIASLTNNAAETITSGIQELQGFIQNGVTQTTTNTATTVQGSAVNIPQGTTATTLGEAINSNAFSAAFSGGEGVKLMMTGSDQTSAGQTRLQGGAQTLTALTKSIGQIGTNISDIANFVNTVGEIGGGISDLVGQYDAEVNPVIVATGSWETVADANEQLQEALAEYKNPQEENSEDGLTFNFDANLFQQAFEKQAV